MARDLRQRTLRKECHTLPVSTSVAFGTSPLRKADTNVRSALLPEHLSELLTALDSRFVAQFADGAIRVIGRELPDSAVCAILPPQPDKVLRIVYDPNKPNALRHTREMVEEWWESFAEPVAFPDGTVEFVRPPCPRASLRDVLLRTTAAIGALSLLAPRLLPPLETLATFA